MTENLLLIPGLNCTAALFAPQIDALGGVCSITVAEHVQASTLEDDAAMILVKAPPRFAVCGLSMGGYLAQELYRQAPDRITRIAILDSRASPDTVEEQERRRTLVTLAEEQCFEAIHAILWPRLVRTAAQGDKTLEGIVLDMMHETGEARFIRQQLALMVRRDYRPLLPSISVPSLILVGADDVVTPPERSRDMAQKIPGADLVEVPDCGHLATLEQPAAVTAALRKWLAR
jgi:pimeloyl-ACP methyl ester carboxylesterase